MGIRTTAAEWMKFIEVPFPGKESYPDQVSVLLGGVSIDETEAFDGRTFVMLHPDEPLVVERGVVFSDGKGTSLLEHFNDWRRENGIPTTTFVTFEIPDERMERFMALIRKHGYGDMVSDDLQAGADLDDAPRLPAP